MSSKKSPESLSFRPLEMADLPMLHEWLCRPHVSEWWQPTPTRAEVEEEFAPLTVAGRDTTRGYIALLGARPIGFIQCYVVMGSGDGWWEEEADPGARGIDQFLANAEELGAGLGSAMVRAFVDRLLLDPEVSKVQTDPSPDNGRAIRSYAKAGFVAHGEVMTPDGPALLMLRTRSTGDPSTWSTR
jgi:RimJ/RimL family protein N-acetyltransferase